MRTLVVLVVLAVVGLAAFFALRGDRARVAVAGTPEAGAFVARDGDRSLAATTKGAPALETTRAYEPVELTPVAAPRRDAGAFGSTAAAGSAARVTVRVRDARSGAAVRDARAWLITEEDVLRALTDAEGRAAFEAPSGAVDVGVDAPQGSTLVRCDAPRVSTLALALAPGEEREVELALEVGASITGLVVDESGTPVEDSPVRCTALGADAALHAEETRTAVTDARGVYEFVGLYPGQYDVSPVLITRRNAGSGGTTRTPHIEVTRGDRLTHNLKLSGRHRVVLRVRPVRSGTGLALPVPLTLLVDMHEVTVAPRALDDSASTCTLALPVGTHGGPVFPPSGAAGLLWVGAHWVSMLSVTVHGTAADRAPRDITLEVGGCGEVTRLELSLNGTPRAPIQVVYTDRHDRRCTRELAWDPRRPTFDVYIELDEVPARSVDFVQVRDDETVVLHRESLAPGARAVVLNVGR